MDRRCVSAADSIREGIREGMTKHFGAVELDLGGVGKMQEPRKVAVEEAKSNIAEVRCVRMTPGGPLRVTQLVNFLTPEEIYRKLGRELYDEWTRGDHMYMTRIGGNPAVVGADCTCGPLVAEILGVGAELPWPLLRERMVFMKKCGARLGELIRKRRMQLKAEEEAKKDAPVKFAFTI